MSRVRGCTVYMHIVPKEISGELNDKYYIGFTGQTVQNRWQTGGAGYKTSTLFYKAIQKYGWDNIEHVIVKEGLKKKDAIKMEASLIKKYKSNNPDYGYNMTKSYHDNAIELDSTPCFMYGLDGKYIRTFPSIAEATRVIGAGVGDSMKKYNSQCHGYQFCGEFYPKGIHPYVDTQQGDKVYQYTLQGEFVKEWPSTKEVFEEYSQAVASALCGRTRKSKGYRWSWEYFPEGLPEGYVSYGQNAR